MIKSFWELNWGFSHAEVEICECIGTCTHFHVHICWCIYRFTCAVIEHNDVMPRLYHTNKDKCMLLFDAVCVTSAYWNFLCTVLKPNFLTDSQGYPKPLVIWYLVGQWSQWFLFFLNQIKAAAWFGNQITTDIIVSLVYLLKHR